MVLSIILASVGWIIVGYGFFYLQYENRDLVVGLRNSLQQANKDVSELSLEAEEHKQQNIILRDKVSELYAKNDDLVGVVSELSRYYYNIRVWAEKLQDLSKHLQIPDQSVEERVKKYSALYQQKQKENTEENASTFF